jgi:hypothetical protein
MDRRGAASYERVREQMERLNLSFALAALDPVLDPGEEVVEDLDAHQ